MKSSLIIQLDTTPEQALRLQALQTAFAEACNALAPVVRETRCWNRVALHHLTYHNLRERFPQLGSQMICNAIYSVSRSSRLVFQHPKSPFNVNTRPDAALPLLKFAASAPVYFDRHTLSIKNGKLSMYTLDGRMHFQLNLKAADLARFQQEKLREIVLARNKRGYQLSFSFHSTQASASQRNPAEAAETAEAAAPEHDFLAGELPEYLLILPPDDLANPPPPAPPLVAAVATL